MKRLCLRASIAVCLIVAVAACTAPIRRVESSNYGWGPRKEVTIEQMQATIEKTARNLGWTLSDVKPGSFVAKREWGPGGRHSIAVDVVYDRKAFSIRYKDSKQMDYSGSSIHHTYNDMVERLRDDIKASISKL
jgi:hypothetical protein